MYYQLKSTSAFSKMWQVASEMSKEQTRVGFPSAAPVE